MLFTFYRLHNLAETIWIKKGSILFSLYNSFSFRFTHKYIHNPLSLLHGRIFSSFLLSFLKVQRFLHVSGHSHEHKSFATSVPHEHIFPVSVISVPSTTFVSFLSILRHLISFLQFLLNCFVMFLGIGNGSRLVSL